MDLIGAKILAPGPKEAAEWALDKPTLAGRYTPILSIVRDRVLWAHREP